MRYDLKEIASGVVRVLMETAKNSVKDGVEVVLVVPIFYKRDLYYQIIARNEDGTIYKMPANLHNSFLEGCPVYEAIRVLLRPGPTEEPVSNKEVQGRVKKVIAELTAQNMCGLCLSHPEIVAVHQIPPLQRRNKLGSLGDYLNGGDLDISWNRDGIVTVREQKFDRREGTDYKINWLIRRILGSRAEVFIQFLALAVFSDRSGKARPIFHLFGIRNSGKSVLAQLFRTVCGSELAGSLSARESMRRWIYPALPFYVLDENAEVDENSLKNLWGFMKILTKTLGPTQWEIKHKQPVEFVVRCYLIASTNDKLFAASDRDEVDNVIGIMMREKKDANELILDGVDVPSYLTGLHGLPFEFIEKTLWPIYCGLDEHHRFGMPIFKDAEYADIEKTDTKKINDVAYEAIFTYCRYVAFCRNANIDMQIDVIDLITDHSGSIDQDRASQGLRLLKNTNCVPLFVLQRLFGRARSVSVEAMKILTARGIDFSTLPQKQNPGSHKGYKVLHLPDALFLNPLTMEEYENLLCGDDGCGDRWRANVKNGTASGTSVWVENTLLRAKVEEISAENKTLKEDLYHRNGEIEVKQAQVEKLKKKVTDLIEKSQEVLPLEKK